MAIDIFSENLVSLREATRLLPRASCGKSLHVSTLWRWTLGGLRSKDGMIIRLESIKIGGVTHTSKEALQRFFERLSGDEHVVTPPPITRRDRERRIRAAEEELRRAGF